MHYSFLNVDGHPSADTDAYCLRLGYAAALMSQSQRHGGFPIAYTRTVVSEAIRQERIKFYFNQDGQPVAYVIWAHLSRNAEAVLAKSGFGHFRREDWNSGAMFWIVDFACSKGTGKYVLRDLRATIMRSESSVRYFRFKNNKRVFKEVDQAYIRRSQT